MEKQTEVHDGLLEKQPFVMVGQGDSAHGECALDERAPEVSAEDLQAVAAALDHNKKKEPKPHRQAYFLPEDGLTAWNPMKAWPRNEACFCMSGKKFKKCCAPNLRETIAASEVPKLQSLVDKMHLIRDIQKGKIK